MTKKCFFVTGTDTNIGKTIASILLLKRAKKLGYFTAGYKPVSSGMKIKKSGKLRNQDVCLLKKFSNVLLSYQQISPFSFIPESAPHIISMHTKIDIDFEKISFGLSILKKKANYIIIEGAGGWYTPLSNIKTYADWVKNEKLPVILIVGIKLGCINHAILTQHAILSEHLCFSGWIANIIVPQMQFHQETIITLKKYLKAPLLGEIPYLKNINDINTLNIDLILPT